MTIAQARLVLADAARNANSDSFNSTHYDYAILAAGNEFVNATRCISNTSTIALGDSDSTIATGEWATGFRADRLQRAWVRDESEDLQIVAYRDVVRMLDEDSTEGVPTHIGFISTTDNAAKVWRTTDAAYTVDYVWYPPFTVYTAGTATDSTELNIPEDLIRPVINAGAVSYLLRSMPENASWVDRLRRDFDEHIKRHRFYANTGVRSAPRSMLS